MLSTDELPLEVHICMLSDDTMPAALHPEEASLLHQHGGCVKWKTDGKDRRMWRGSLKDGCRVVAQSPI